MTYGTENLITLLSAIKCFFGDHKRERLNVVRIHRRVRRCNGRVRQPDGWRRCLSARRLRYGWTRLRGRRRLLPQIEFAILAQATARHRAPDQRPRASAISV